MRSTRRVASNADGSHSFLRAYAEFAGAATPRRRSESRLNAARIDAELSSRSKSEFIAHMSHDLRTPLNAIIGFSDVLCSGELADSKPAKVREYASDIKHAGQHLLQIINDVLDLAKLESGRPDFDLEPCDLRDVVQTTVLIVGLQAEGKLQLLSSSVAEDVPLLRLDPLRTKQIAINLLSNAVKFSPTGSVIRIVVERAEGGVNLVVVDRGAGMSPEDMTVALSRFGRVRNAATRSQEGSGLGLTIVRQLCEAQGARFDLQSQVGQGTRAIVHFPESIIVQADNNQ